jgi:hypothetical protein
MSVGSMAKKQLSSGLSLLFNSVIHHATNKTWFPKRTMQVAK